MVAIDQICWYVDILGKIFFGKYPIGAAAYMSWTTTSFMKKCTSFHHLWFIPLALYTIDFKLHILHFVLSAVLASYLSIYARFGTPFHCLIPEKKHHSNTKTKATATTTTVPATATSASDCTSSSNSSSCPSSSGNDTIAVASSDSKDCRYCQEGCSCKILYLNINMGYSFWKDIKPRVFHIFDHQYPVVYLPYLSLLCNFAMNLPAYFIVVLVIYMCQQISSLGSSLGYFAWDWVVQMLLSNANSGIVAMVEWYSKCIDSVFFSLHHNQ
jgi:hypothetical protein